MWLGSLLSCAGIVCSDSSSSVVAAAHLDSSPFMHSCGCFGSSPPPFLFDFAYFGSLLPMRSLCGWDCFCRVQELSEVIHPCWSAPRRFWVRRLKFARLDNLAHPPSFWTSPMLGLRRRCVALCAWNRSNCVSELFEVSYLRRQSPWRNRVRRCLCNCSGFFWISRINMRLG